MRGTEKQGDGVKVTRRCFLTGLGAALAWVATGCGRRVRQTPVSPTDAIRATSTPSPTLAPGPTFTPLPTTDAADLVLLNGKVITVDSADTIAQAVAVSGNQILAVGATGEIERYVGSGTQSFDLEGRAVTPGMIDPHNHFQVMGQMNGFYIPFMPPEIRTIAELQGKLAEVVAQLPEGEWVNGYFLVVAEGRLPTRHDLDPVSPNHPVFILQQGGHYGSANSLALQMAGITADTPSPPGGLIEKDASGEPTGVFYNHRAMDVLRRVIPYFTTEDVHQFILSTQPLFAAAGVTSFQDNNVRGVETVRTYMDVARAGELYLRGSVYYTLEWPGDVERALNEMDHHRDDFIRFAGFKFLLDGQAHMAYCHEPHDGVRWDLPTWEPQTFKDAVRQLHDTGLQICVHCVGDAAVDLTLDAYEEAMNANPRPDPRHRIEHCVLSTPQAIQRMKDLGVVVSTQPQFLRLGGVAWTRIFGEERARRAMVTREWLDAGVPVALGSDAPTTPWYTPQVTLFGAVTRISMNNEFHEPDQAMTIQEALRAHTMIAAYAGHEEDIKGSIEAGKLADLAVWNADPYTVPLKDLWTTTIDMTIVDGKIVYQV
jgi:predicted amidohydrolase YtcJ